MNRFVQGILCSLIGATLWGFSGACAQFLFTHYNISSTFITVVRMLGAGALFVIVLAIRNRATLSAILHRKHDLLRLVVFGGVGLYLSQITYLIVIGYTNAGTATVLQSLNIVIVMMATCLIMRRRPLLRETAGLACALVATFLIATGGNPLTLVLPIAGLLWGLANAASVAFYTMYPRRLFQQYGSMAVTGLGMLAGGIVAAIVWCISAAIYAATGCAAGEPIAVPALDGIGWLILGLIVLVGTCGAFGLFLRGVSIIGGVKSSMLGAIEPVSATLFSALWLGTLFTGADWAGLILMVATIFLVSAQRE